jgi:hypothetical protein
VYRGLARYIWGKIVQLRLDQYKAEHADHKIRKQNNRLLPSGGRPRQFYENPERYNGMNSLIAIPSEDIQSLISQFVPADLFYFCSPTLHEAATDALFQLGNPELTVHSGWAVFSQVLPMVQIAGITEGVPFLF